EIDGRSFTHATNVTFNGVSAGAPGVGFTVVDDTRIKATVPPAATSGKVTVTTPSGSGSSAVGYTVIQKPTIASFTPASGGAGTTVAINGAGLDFVTQVLLGGGEVASGAGIVHLGAKQLKFVLPVGAATGRFRVVNPAGTSLPSTGTFTVTGLLGALLLFA